MRHVIQGADLRAVQLTSNGAPRGGVLYASTDEFVFTTGQFHADIRSRGIMHPELMTFGVHLDEHAVITQWSAEALPGDIFVYAPGGEQEGRSTGRMTYATVSISVDAMMQIASGDAAIGDRGFWERKQHFRATPRDRAEICRSILAVASQLRDADVAMSGQRLELFQHAVIESFLRGIIFDEDQPLERSAYPGSKVVKRVEELIDGQEPGTIHIADVCNALNLPRRTLERAFHETLGMGPARYLMLHRLSTVRSILRSADPDSTRVSDVAMDYGFFELGRFSATYRRMFSEYPSETLRQRSRSGRRAPQTLDARPPTGF